LRQLDQSPIFLSIGRELKQRLVQSSLSQAADLSVAVGGQQLWRKSLRTRAVI
jgi:hypothetical protein